MKFNSQICTTKEQSERLLALGLKKETADCQHWAYTKDSRGNSIPKRNQRWFTRIGTDESVQVCGFMDATFIPAWSLHRLWQMMPNKIAYPTIYDSAPLRINKDSIYYLHRFFDKYGDEDFSTVGDNEAIGSHNVYDYAVSVIGFLIKEGYFNKEYLGE